MSDPPVQDFVDRAAEVQVKISLPNLVQEVVAELSQEKETASTALQRTIDSYAAKNDVRAFMGILGQRWIAARPFKRYPCTRLCLA